MDPMRSQKMTFVQLIVPAESSHRAVSYLGELGLLQFRDLNADKSPFQRTFVNQGKKCAEMSRKLRFFKDQIQKASLMSFAHPAMLEDVELEELEASGFLVSSKNHAVAEERELDDHVYSNDDYADTASLLEQEMRHEPSNQSGLRFISGIISKSKLLGFERMLFHATRGNMLFNQAPADEPILDPVTTEMVEKMVFVVFFSGEQAKTKTMKICEAFVQIAILYLKI
ncbi:unnamed protein product [Camellia sinensis]